MRKYNQNEKVKQSKALYFSSFEKLYKSCVSPREQAPERYLYEYYNNNIYIRLFKLFPNLITKESYNWWVTRRVWGFRHQISKAKYLKISKAKCRSHISGSFRRTQRHCAKWLRNSPGKRYKRIRICLTGEVETPFSLIRRQASDAKYPEKVCAGCKTSGWNGGGAEFWM